MHSDTDAEVVAHLIALHYDGSLTDAVRRSLLDDLTGHFAFVAMCDDEPDTLVGVRRECPLVVGVGEEERFIASSISAFHAHTRDIVLLEDNEVVTLRPGETIVEGSNGLAHEAQITTVDWDEDACDKDGYETFMLKEIHEQGTAVGETLEALAGDCAAPGSILSTGRLSTVDRIVIVACGTSYHAGLAGPRRRSSGGRACRLKSRLPRSSASGSDRRRAGRSCWRSPQSGETADTLAAMRLARAQGRPPSSP